MVRLIAVAAVLYGALVVLLFVMERTLLYPASAYRTTAGEAGLADFEAAACGTGATGRASSPTTGAAS